MATPCRLSATAYSIYSQVPSISEAVPPSATWGRALPWWQGPTYHGMPKIIFAKFHLRSITGVGGREHTKGRRRYFDINNVDLCPGLLLFSYFCVFFYLIFSVTVGYVENITLGRKLWIRLSSVAASCNRRTWSSGHFPSPVLFSFFFLSIWYNYWFYLLASILLVFPFFPISSGFFLFFFFCGSSMFIFFIQCLQIISLSFLLYSSSSSSLIEPPPTCSCPSSTSRIILTPYSPRELCLCL